MQFNSEVAAGRLDCRHVHIIGLTESRVPVCSTASSMARSWPMNRALVRKKAADT